MLIIFVPDYVRSIVLHHLAGFTHDGGRCLVGVCDPRLCAVQHPLAAVEVGGGGRSARVTAVTCRQHDDTHTSPTKAGTGSRSYIRGVMNLSIFFCIIWTIQQSITIQHGHLLTSSRSDVQYLVSAQLASK